MLANKSPWRIINLLQYYAFVVDFMWNNIAKKDILQVRLGKFSSYIKLSFIGNYLTWRVW